MNTVCAVTQPMYVQYIYSNNTFTPIINDNEHEPLRYQQGGPEGA